MITIWMVFTLVIGLLFTGAAIAGERLARALKRPTRHVWIAAVLATLVWPMVASWRSEHVPASAATAITVPGQTTPVQRMNAAVVYASTTRVGHSMDTIVLVVWGVLTLMLGSRMVYSITVLRRRRQAWPCFHVDGQKVRVSPDVGPAVIGLSRMEVVLPEWVLAFDTSLRALILRHEQEHRDAGDPYVLFAAAVCLIAMPWNVALWWQVWRLRLAIEIDCDARVLRVHPHHERYGLLLLALAQHRANTPTLFAPALVESPSQLERRIIAMRTRAFSVSRSRMLVFGSIAFSIVALACSIEAPAPTPKAKAASPMASSGVVTPDATVYFEFQVEKQAQQDPNSARPEYPKALRNAGVEGEVRAQFVVDTTGRVDPASLKVLASTNELFTAAIRSALPGMQFFPAEVGGQKVRQLVEQPFTFALSR